MRASRGIATSGLHQCDRLPTDPRLGGSKDEEEEHRSDHRARERDDHHLTSDVVHRLQDGSGIPPDGDDCLYGTPIADREVLAEQRWHR